MSPSWIGVRAFRHSTKVDLCGPTAGIPQKGWPAASLGGVRASGYFREVRVFETPRHVLTCLVFFFNEDTIVTPPKKWCPFVLACLMQGETGGLPVSNIGTHAGCNASLMTVFLLRAFLTIEQRMVSSIAVNEGTLFKTNTKTKLPRHCLVLCTPARVRLTVQFWKLIRGIETISLDSTLLHGEKSEGGPGHSWRN